MMEDIMMNDNASEDTKIFLVETFEKEDLMDTGLADKYLTNAERREFSAKMILDPKYAEMARMLAAWDRKVAAALKRYHKQ